MTRTAARQKLPPQPFHLRTELFGRHVIVGAPKSRPGVFESPVLCARVGKLHKASGLLPGWGKISLCHPTQASSSSSGFVLVARMRLRSLMLRHFCLASCATRCAAGVLQDPPFAGMRHHTEASHRPLFSLPVLVIVRCGAARESFSSMNLRRKAGGQRHVIKPARIQRQLC